MLNPVQVLLLFLFFVLCCEIMTEMIDVCVVGSIIECNTLIWGNSGSEGGGVEHPVLKLESIS